MTAIIIDILIVYLLIYVRSAMSPHTKKIVRDANVNPFVPWIVYLIWPRLAFCDGKESFIFFYRYELLWVEPE